MSNTRPKQPHGKSNKVKPQYEEQHNMQLSNKACNLKMHYAMHTKYKETPGLKRLFNNWENHIHKTNQQLEEQGSQKQLDSRRTGMDAAHVREWGLPSHSITRVTSSKLEPFNPLVPKLMRVWELPTPSQSITIESVGATHSFSLWHNRECGSYPLRLRPSQQNYLLKAVNTSSECVPYADLGNYLGTAHSSQLTARYTSRSSRQLLQVQQLMTTTRRLQSEPKLNLDRKSWNPTHAASRRSPMYSLLSTPNCPVYSSARTCYQLSHQTARIPTDHALTTAQALNCYSSNRSPSRLVYALDQLASLLIVMTSSLLLTAISIICADVITAGVLTSYLSGTCAWLQPVFQEPGASRLIAVATSIRSTNRSETPSSDCTRSPDEISTIGFSSKKLAGTNSGEVGGGGGGARRAAAAARRGKRGEGGRGG
ncbi:hypothetical protein F511_10048 [Dorcoceras hygrometricum]|uniref:Uncharacterized protein n=1 Tax=Dorcoceras hygrometricum TaxID=472368 RepID=A0A2Z7ADN6_9LAMI|nr:hypothetical protein F511_10048 [Dorcoceras hygrometricum]